MPSRSPTSLPIRTRGGEAPRNKKHAPSNSFSENDLLPTARDAVHGRPHKRPATAPRKTIAVVNASGRQAASLIRVASAVGYSVRAQLRNLDHVYAKEVSELPNVTILLGDLYSTASPRASPRSSDVNHELIDKLFQGAQLAFINTTFYGNEVEIGKALADAAVACGIEHYIYSSMPDHHAFNPSWPSLPMWSTKAAVEDYIRDLSPRLPSTFIYTGIYNNNFTSLPYPLFCMELQSDGSFEWVAPFHPDVPLPWLDAEHDVGPAVLQVFKDGPKYYADRRITLAYEMLSPVEACHVFSRGVSRPVTYRYEPKIGVKVKIPQGYREQLEKLEELYAFGAEDGKLQPPYFGSEELEKQCPGEAMQLWEGYRGLEEYAREVFPLEEAANGLKWMEDDGHHPEESDVDEGRMTGGEEEEEEDEADEADESGSEQGLTMKGDAPARKQETWLA